GLGGYEARHVVAGDPSDLAELLESLPHADEANATAGRIDDDVGQLPFELLGELEAHRLLPLDAVRLLQGRCVVPAALGTRALHDRARVRDRARDEIHLRAVRRGLAHDRLRRCVRHHDDNADARARPVCGPGSSGVACCGERDRAHAKLERSGDADRGAACLERPGRQQALVLHAQVWDSELLPYPARVEERRHRLAERHDVRGIVHREELAVAPHRRGPPREDLTLHRLVDSLEVVPNEERTTIVGACLLQRVELEVLAAARALEVRRERCHAARSIFAPSARRRVSRSWKPRSICSTLLMTLLPVAQSVAARSAMPARMSGLRSSAARSFDGPITTARCGSASTMCAPISRVSVSTKKSLPSNIHSWMSTTPSACVANAVAMLVRSVGKPGHTCGFSVGIASPRSGSMR